ncbi:MAG: preprotein translocase subunit YajC [Candidatus Methylomirabilales bacterium]
MLAPTLAYAGALGDGGAGGYQALIPLLLMFAVFYFILIRPQQQKQKKHREVLQNLKTGDQVITSGGLYGTIVAIDEQKITLRIADNVKVEVGRSFVASRVGWEVEKKKD